MRDHLPEFWDRLHRLGKAMRLAARRLDEAQAEAAAPRVSRWDIGCRGSGPRASSVEQAAERLEELRAEYDAARDAFMTEWAKVSAISRRFSDVLFYAIARDRYFYGESWDTVAKMFGYSRAQCLRLHKAMISEAAELLPAVDARPAQTAAPAAKDAETGRKPRNFTP